MTSIFVGPRLRARSAFLCAASLLATALCSPASADVIPPKVDTTSKWGVSPPDVQYRLDVTDLSIGNMKLERFTQSPSLYWPDKSQFGMLMTSNFDIYVEATFEKASGPPNNLPNRYHDTVHIGNSSVGVFNATSNTGTGTISPLNIDAQAGSLAWSGSTYVFTDKLGAVYTFGGPSAHPTGLKYVQGTGAPTSQRVTQIAYPDGRVQQFYYSGTQLKLVTDSDGYAILFDIGSNGFISDACAINLARTYVTTSSTCAGQPLTVQYQYGTVANLAGTVPVLTGFTDVLSQTTTYTQDTRPTITCVQPPGATSCQISVSNTGSGMLSQTLADGEVWQYYTDQDPPSAGDPDNVPVTSGSATVTDPAGHVLSYNFERSSPLSATDANSHTTTYNWCCSQFQELGAITTHDGTLLTEADFPEGNKYLAYYNGAFNSVTEERLVAKPGSGLADQVVDYTYGPTLPSGVVIAKPLSKKTPNGNETDWTYTSFGEVASEMQPAPSSGAARPLELYTYVQKSAYILNSGGTLVASGHPTWVIASETECQTVAGSNSPVCDSGAQQKVTTYEYGADGTANNLNVRGVVVTADGTSRRTCSSYDDYGNRISQTLPRAGLSSCP